MRVTLGGLTLNFLNNLNASLQRLSDLQDTVSSGKRIRAPSDDPIAVPVMLLLRDALAASSQYARNLEDTRSLLAAGEQTLGDATHVTQTIRSLAVQAANDTLSSEDRLSIRTQVSELLDHLVTLGNAAVGGRYLFAGTHTSEAPFTRSGDAVTYQGNEDAVEREIDAGLTLNAAVSGSAAFVAGTDGVFPSVSRLLAALDAADSGAVRDEIAGLDGGLDALTIAQTTLGSRSARVELMKNRLADMDVNLSGLLAERQDADIPKAIMELRREETAYQSALAAGARLLQPTLLEFLR